METIFNQDSYDFDNIAAPEQTLDEDEGMMEIVAELLSRIATNNPRLAAVDEETDDDVQELLQYIGANSWESFKKENRQLLAQFWTTRVKKPEATTPINTLAMEEDYHTKCVVAVSENNKLIATLNEQRDAIAKEGAKLQRTINMAPQMSKWDSKALEKAEDAKGQMVALHEAYVDLKDALAKAKAETAELIEKERRQYAKVRHLRCNGNLLASQFDFINLKILANMARSCVQEIIWAERNAEQALPKLRQGAEASRFADPLNATRHFYTDRNGDEDTSGGIYQSELNRYQMHTVVIEELMLNFEAVKLEFDEIEARYQDLYDRQAPKWTSYEVLYRDAKRRSLEKAMETLLTAQAKAARDVAHLNGQQVVEDAPNPFE